jgi:exonuclease SbcD
MTKTVKRPIFLLLNDIHVSKNDIKAFCDNWDEALTVAHFHDISKIIIGGDLWESRSGQTLSTLSAVRDALMQAKQEGIDVYIAEGNHCKVDQEATIGYSHIFSEYPGVTVVDEALMLTHVDNVALTVMSYFPENGSFVERYESIAKEIDPNCYNILYIHQGINGALSTSSDSELPATMFKAFDKVLVGHYHDRCKIPGTNVEYIGASRQHNFGEDEMKGYTIVYSDGSTQFIQNEVNQRYLVITVQANQLDTLPTLTESNVKVKLKVECAPEEAKSINRNALINAGYAKVEIASKEVMLTQSADGTGSFDSKFDIAGIKEEYKSFCTQKEIDNVQLGLNYLNKIN